MRRRSISHCRASNSGGDTPMSAPVGGSCARHPPPKPLQAGDRTTIPPAGHPTGGSYAKKAFHMFRGVMEGVLCVVSTQKETHQTHNHIHVQTGIHRGTQRHIHSNRLTVTRHKHIQVKTDIRRETQIPCRTPMLMPCPCECQGQCRAHVKTHASLVFHLLIF